MTVLTISHFYSSRVRRFSFRPQISACTHNTLTEEQQQSETWFRMTFTVKRKLLSLESKRTFQRRYEDRDRGERKEAAALWHSSDVCWAWLATLWEPSFRLAPVHFLCTTTTAAAAECPEEWEESPFHLWPSLLNGCRNSHLCPSCSWISAICSSLLLQSGACKHVLTGHGPLQWHGVLAWTQSLAQRY